MRRVGVLAMAIAVLAAASAIAIASASLAAPEIAAAAGGTTAPDCGCGNVTQYTYAGPTSQATGPESYLVFTPDGYTGRQRVPLVVVTHGCNTTAAEQEGANNYDQLAEKYGFIIMYPDNNDNAHPGQCWQFYNQDSQRRGQGDLATIAGMTRTVMTMRNVDPERVYEIGMSSGALITSDLAAAYPDLYAAIGIMAGGPFGNDTCLTGDAGVTSLGDPSQEASAAFEEEGPRARVMPFIVLNGDKDTTVSPGCDDQAVLQWLRTDNLVLSGQQTEPLSLTPSSDHAATAPGGYAYDVVSYTKPGGCLIGQHYVIHGMGHYWSGGTSNAAYSAYTDPKGPSASAASWAFFSQYTLRGTNGSCATKPKATAKHKAKPQPKHRKAHRHGSRPRHDKGPRDHDHDHDNEAGGRN